jgi:hypothetical protein
MNHLSPVVNQSVGLLDVIWQHFVVGECGWIGRAFGVILDMLDQIIQGMDDVGIVAGFSFFGAR